VSNSSHHKVGKGVQKLSCAAHTATAIATGARTHTQCAVCTRCKCAVERHVLNLPGATSAFKACAGVCNNHDIRHQRLSLAVFFFNSFYIYVYKRSHTTTTTANTAAVASWNYLSIVLNENKSRLTFQPWKRNIIKTWQQQRLWFPATLELFFPFSFVLLLLCHADHDKFIAIYCSGGVCQNWQDKERAKNTQEKLHNSPRGGILHFHSGPCEHKVKWQLYTNSL